MSEPAAGVDVLVVGSVFCDVIFAGAEVPEVGGESYARGFAISPGGVATRAVAAARAGASVRLLTHLGDDPLGRHVHGLLDAEPGLDTSWVVHVPDHQSPVSVSLTNTQNRSFITYIEDLGPLDLPCAVGPVGAVHIGVADELPSWVQMLRDRGTVIVGGVGWDATGTLARDGAGATR